MQAMMVPVGKEEKAITGIVCGLDGYAALLRQEQEHMSSEQYSQLMATVVTMTRAALSLTSGPLGRLDGAMLREKLAEIAGIDLESTTVVQLHDPSKDFASSSADGGIASHQIG